MAKSVITFGTFGWGTSGGLNHNFPASSNPWVQGGVGRNGSAAGNYVWRGNFDGGNFSSWTSPSCRIDTGTLGTNRTTGAATFAFYNSNSGIAGFMVGDGTSPQLTFTFDTLNLVINVYRGSTSGTLLYSLPVVGKMYHSIAWNTVQCAWKIDASSGWLFIRLNGYKILDTYSSPADNTRATANSYWNRWMQGAPGDTQHCDVAVWDMDTDNPNSLLADYRACLILPASDTSKMSTPNSGSTAYSRLNQVTQDGDSTYTDFAAVADEDIYGTNADVVRVPDNSTIVAVQTSVLTKQSDASPVSYKTGLKSGGTVSYGSTYFSPSGGYVSTGDRFDVDPDTSSPWTPSGLRAAQIVLNRVS